MNRVLERFHVVAIDGGEFVAAAGFAIEKLQHGHSVHVLLQVRIDARDRHADSAITLLDGSPEHGGDQHHDGQHGEQQPGHAGAHAQHHDDDEAQHQNVAQNGHQSGGPQFVQRIDVGGDAGDQAAHRIAVVIGDVERLQVLHQFAPQIEHGELAGALHQIRFDELADEADQQRGEIERGNLREAGPHDRTASQGSSGEVDGMVGLGEIAIDGELGQQGSGHLRDRLQQQKKQRHGHRAAIWLQIPDQPPHEAAVIRFAEDFFFQNPA